MKHNPSNQLPVGISTSFPQNISASNNFRMLWDELAVSSQNFSKISTYIPTESQISQFGMVLQNNDYLIKGYFQVDNDFDESKLNALGGKMTKYSDKFQSYTIPIKKITDFVRLKGIKYIELSIKVYRKKNN